MVHYYDLTLGASDRQAAWERLNEMVLENPELATRVQTIQQNNAELISEALTLIYGGTIKRLIRKAAWYQRSCSLLEDELRRTEELATEGRRLGLGIPNYDFVKMRKSIIGRLVNIT
mgnify:CR=1 FL=1